MLSSTSIWYSCLFRSQESNFISNFPSDINGLLVSRQATRNLRAHDDTQCHVCFDRIEGFLLNQGNINEFYFDKKIQGNVMGTKSKKCKTREKSGNFKYFVLLSLIPHKSFVYVFQYFVLI